MLRNVRFEVLTAVLLKPHAFWYAAVSSSVNINHFIIQLMHITYKNVELLKHLQGNHHQGAIASA